MLPHIERFGEFPEGQYPDNDLYTELYYNRSTTNPYSKHHPWWTRSGLWSWESWLLRHRSLALLRNTTNPRVKQVAARLLAATTEHPVPLVAEEDQGYAAIAQAIHAYENCETYIDYGVFYKPRGFGRYTFFATAYERDGRFQQVARYRNTPRARDWSFRVAWVDAAKTSLEWDSYTKQIETRPQIFGAVQFQNMINALMPKESFFSPLAMFQNVELIGQVEIRGRKCYYVKGDDLGGGSMSFHIDVATDLVIRREHMDMIAKFEPAFDAPISADWWRSDPENLEDWPLMQRLDEMLRDIDSAIEHPAGRP